MPEKNLSFLLSLNDDIATVTDHKKLLLKIFAKLCDYYNFTLGGVALFDLNRESLRIILGQYMPEFSTIEDHPVSWGAMFSLDSIPFALPADVGNLYVKLVDVKHFTSLIPLSNSIPPLEKVLREMSIKQLLFIPIQTGGELLGYLIISQQEYSFIETDKDYLIKIGNIFASALSNTIAYEVLQKKEKEKEQQIALLSSMVSFKEKDDFIKALSEGINGIIPFNYIAYYVNNFKGQSLTNYLIKNNDSVFFSPEATRSEILAIQTLASKNRSGTGSEYFETSDDSFENICKDFSHFRDLKDKNNIHSLVALRSVHSGMGELNIILGRTRSILWEMEKTIDFIFTRAKNSLFSINEINLALDLLPQLGLILANINSFEEIRILTKKLEQEKNYLLEEINLTNSFQEIIGNSSSIKITLNKIEQVAPLDATVLIQGETGTGKELIAKAVHNLSGRKHRSFITVNCAALPAQLIESELFGHEKGSFTGAIEKRIGKFEVADGGTIFLDEIGELPLEIQAKLLRVLQEKEFERLGGKSTIYSDVRIVAATNRDLEKEVKLGKFRADLFFRLNVFPVFVPPLRERTEDIPLLVKHFIDKYSKRIGRKIESIKKNSLNLLVKYEWPGNIRELEHFIERAIIISKGPNLDFENMLNISSGKGDKNIKSLEANEKEHIIKALKMANGKITGENSASQLLGINGKTLGSKMRKLGIKRGDLLN